MTALASQSLLRASHAGLLFFALLALQGFFMAYMLGAFMRVNSRLAELEEHTQKTRVLFDSLDAELAIEANQTRVWRASVGSTIRLFANIALPGAILDERGKRTFPGAQFEVLLALSGRERDEVVNAYVTDEAAGQMVINTSDDSYIRLVNAGFNVSRGISPKGCHPAFHMMCNVDRLRFMFEHGLNANISCHGRLLCNCLIYPWRCFGCAESNQTADSHALSALNRRLCL